MVKFILCQVFKLRNVLGILLVMVITAGCTLFGGTGGQNTVSEERLSIGFTGVQSISCTQNYQKIDLNEMLRGDETRTFEVECDSAWKINNKLYYPCSVHRCHRLMSVWGYRDADGFLRSVTFTSRLSSVVIENTEPEHYDLYHGEIFINLCKVYINERRGFCSSDNIIKRSI